MVKQSLVNRIFEFHRYHDSLGEGLISLAGSKFVDCDTEELD